MRGKFVAWIMAPLKSVLYRCSGNFERVSVIHLSSHKQRRSPSETKRGRGEKLMGEGEKERVDIYSRRRAGGVCMFHGIKLDKGVDSNVAEGRFKAGQGK